MKPLEITVDEMSEENIVEYAIASASCFPAFPIHYINKQGYIDGGYYDNLPISLALKMGAQKLLLLSLIKSQRINIFYIVKILLLFVPQNI